MITSLKYVCRTSSSCFISAIPLSCVPTLVIFASSIIFTFYNPDSGGAAQGAAARRRDGSLRSVGTAAWDGSGLGVEPGEDHCNDTVAVDMPINASAPVGFVSLSLHALIIPVSLGSKSCDVCHRGK